MTGTPLAIAWPGSSRPGLLWPGAASLAGGGGPVFPEAPLDCEIDLDLGGTWTGVTAYTLQREGTSPPVTITRGRANETATVTPSTCGMQWNNRDGRFSPRNPTGPYYGLLNRNTPVRVSVPGSSAAMRLEDDQVSYASAPGPNITGSLDIRVDMQLSSYYSSVLVMQLRPVSTGGWSFLLQTDNDGTLGFFWIDSSSGEHVISSGVPLPSLGRQAVRVTLDVTTGNVTFYTAPTMAGTFTQFAAVSGSGATSVQYLSGSTLCVGGPETGGPPAGSTAASGLIYEAQVWSGIAGTLEADPQFYQQSPGASTFTDAQGNTWTLVGTAMIDDRNYRGHFECSSLPQLWDPTGTDVWTPVSASGIMRRLQQGNSPVSSVFRRGILSYTGTLFPVAYWPMEDAQGSTQIASGLPGGAAGTFSSAVPGFTGQAGSPSADTTFACSASLPALNNSVIRLPVPGYTSNGAIVVRFLMNFSDTPATGTPIIKLDISGGSCATIILYWGTGGAMQLSGYSHTGSVVFNSGMVGFFIDAIPVWASIELTPSGSLTDWKMVFLGPGAGGYNASYSGSFTGTVGKVTSLIFDQSASLSSTTVGQVTVQSAYVSMTSLLPQLSAYSGETAGLRFARLCAENNINFRVYGFPSVSAVMGPQTIDTLANLFQYCETTDCGQLYEPVTCLGLGYRTLASLCNQAPALTLDYASAQIGGDGSAGLTPTDDDTYTINDVTVSRNEGSSAQIQITTGDMSIQPPPAGVGDYTTSITAYCAWDSQLPDIAGWIARIGTTDTERYPQVPLNLARPQLSGLTAGITAVDIGDYVQITSPPAWLPPGPISQLAWGVAEKLGGFWWLLSWNTVPEAPYETAVAGSSNTAGVAHAQTAGTQLAQAVTSGAVSLLVQTTAGAVWTTAGSDFPFDITVSGERMTVTAIANQSNSVTSPAANANIVFWSVAAGTYTVYWSVTLSGTLSGSDSNNFALYNGSAFVASSVNLAKAGTYPQKPQTLTVTSGAPDIKILSGGTTPTTGAVYRATISNPQTMTVTRSVNGVVKAQAAGAAVSLFSVPAAALAGVK